MCRRAHSPMRTTRSTCSSGCTPRDWPAPSSSCPRKANHACTGCASGPWAASRNSISWPPAAPASLTKLMTAYVVFKALAEGRLKLTDMVTVSEHAWRTGGSRSFVQVGMQIPVDILIKGMIVQSGNDASIALAEKVGGTEAAFAQMMTEYDRRLGMQSSKLVNRIGLAAP